MSRTGARRGLREAVAASGPAAPLRSAACERRVVMGTVHSPDYCVKRGKAQAPVTPAMEPPWVPGNATMTRFLHASAMWIPRGRTFSGLEPGRSPAAWYTRKGLGRLNMNLGRVLPERKTWSGGRLGYGSDGQGDRTYKKRGADTAASLFLLG